MVKQEELARLALLGTENQSIPSAILEELKSEGLSADQAENMLLADASALLYPIKKAGFPINEYNGDLPERLEGQEELSCSLKSAEHLRLILDGKFANALPEFIACLLENGLTLPTEHLPALLQRKDLNEWWHLLEPALGTRGKWLLRQNPQWKKLVEDVYNLDWETGTKEERLRLIRGLRKEKPAMAISILESTWDKESPRDKVAFLNELFGGLNTASDEAFLENCRIDRRKNVRQKAIELLTLLPDSNFGERMFDRAKSCLDWSRSKMKIDIPDEPDDAAVADGILKFDDKWKGGKKAAYLGQVVSNVPPSLWELTWDRQPLDIIQQFEKTDWSETLLSAVAQASIRYEDDTWNSTLMKHWFEDETSPLWMESFGAELLSMASTETIQDLGLSFLKNNAGLPDEDTALFQLFLSNENPWEEELCTSIIERFRGWLRQTKKPNWNTFHYKELLQMVAYRCPIGMYEKLKGGWDNRVPLWAFWEKNIKEMLEVVFFRNQIRLEMETMD